MSNTVNLAERFANSEAFKQLFQDGMGLVEESAAYLDGKGRENAKGLSRTSAMLYGSESMRLTTRLMQIASWLLLQRAHNEGEMNRAQLLEEKKKIKLDETSPQTDNPGWMELPADFLDLVSRSLALQARVINLDKELYGHELDETPQQSNNPVDQQINLLSTAFGAARK